MVTYDFYKNVYLGSVIPETAFAAAVARAEEWIAKVERTCSVTPCGPDSRAMAVCAVAEAMAANKKRQQVSQATIGGVSIRYEDSARLESQLLKTLGVYMDICRGVG